MTTPIIIFGDHPAANSGLARILRDLATRIHSEMSDTFRVASLGYGSPGSSKLPFPQYHWNERDDFLPLELPRIWRDFCGDDPGILMTIGDIQRFLPLADTKFASDRKFADWMSQMRLTGLLKLWGYFPIDAHNKDGKLGPQLAHTLSHYDRRLVPSEWAKKIVERTLPNHPVEAIPHGIDTSIFHPRPKESARDEFGSRLADVIAWPQTVIDIPDDALWVGIVAANQQRKDWGLGIEIAAELRKSRPIALWCHIDAIKREWSLLELLSDFNLLDCAIVTVGNVSDEVMAFSYSAMDITLGIGRGEGFGYPIAESILCGVPCFAFDYGAHTDWVDSNHLWTSLHQRIEGPLNLLRPIVDPVEAARHTREALEFPICPPTNLDWTEVWPRFSTWFLEGVQ